MKSFEVLIDEPKYELVQDESAHDKSHLDKSCRDGPRLGKISFEISNGEARQACSIRVIQQDEALALAFFHTNWPVIGKMAREALDAGDIENGEVRLVAPA